MWLDPKPINYELGLESQSSTKSRDPRIVLFPILPTTHALITDGVKWRIVSGAASAHHKSFLRFCFSAVLACGLKILVIICELFGAFWVVLNLDYSSFHVKRYTRDGCQREF